MKKKNKLSKLELNKEKLTLLNPFQSVNVFGGDDDRKKCPQSNPKNTCKDTVNTNDTDPS